MILDRPKNVGASHTWMGQVKVFDKENAFHVGSPVGFGKTIMSMSMLLGQGQANILNLD